MAYVKWSGANYSAACLVERSLSLHNVAVLSTCYENSVYAEQLPGLHPKLDAKRLPSLWLQKRVSIILDLFYPICSPITACFQGAPSIVGRTSGGQPVTTLTHPGNCVKGPQPLLVPGVYPQGAPIVVQGDNPKVQTIFFLFLVVRSAWKSEAFWCVGNLS